MNRTVIKEALSFILSPIGILFFKPNRVLFRGLGEYDSSWALYQYCLKNRKDLEVKFVCDNGNLNKLYCYAMMSSYKVVFSSDACDRVYSKATKNVFLGHGTPFKKVEKYIEKTKMARPEFVISSENVILRFKSVFDLSLCSFFTALAPRDDLLIPDNLKLEKFRQKIGFKDGEKVVGVFLTFRRKENSKSLDESVVIPFDVNYEKLDSKLKSMNIRLVIKLHRAFENVDFGKNTYSNIVFMTNSQCLECNLEPTAFLSCCDALVSDYSSAFIDYLLLDRPLFFFVGDFEKYKNNSTDGFLFDNVQSLMPGEKFTNEKELVSILEHYAGGLDEFKMERRKVCKFFNNTESLANDCCETVINHYFPKEGD